MKQYIDWHGIWIFAVIVAGQAFTAAYPYINPANPQYLTAIQTVIMVVLLAIYQHGRVTMKQQVVDARPTTKTPIIPQGINLPQRPSRED